MCRLANWSINMSITSSVSVLVLFPNLKGCEKIADPSRKVERCFHIFYAGSVQNFKRTNVTDHQIYNCKQPMICTNHLNTAYVIVWYFFVLIIKEYLIHTKTKASDLRPD